jgi:hypothetical protein
MADTTEQLAAPEPEDGISFRALHLILNDLIYQMRAIESRKGMKVAQFTEMIRLMEDLKTQSRCEKAMTIVF